jgi:thioredoxin reductase
VSRSRPLGIAEHDAIVVGAGPYGLSAAAHLLGRGLDVAVFGRPLESWRRRMPKGMLLRSHWWATNLSDPRGDYGFARFFRESTHAPCYPLPIDAFIEYGLWFQQRAVPDVDETYVASVERRDGRFLVTLQDGRQARATAVVMAPGLSYYARWPAPYGELPAGLVSHSSEHADLGRFRDRHVLVVGGGQSAVESAALLHEAGATVDLVSRRPILWLERDRASERTRLEKIRAPDAGIAPGWDNWILEHLPYLFYRFSQERKDRYIGGCGVPAASEWLRDRVLGKVAVHDGESVVGITAMDGALDVAFSGGGKVRADHVLLGTGYAVDIDRLTMLHPSLRRQIRTEEAVPILNAWFESSVPRLYFVGLTSLRAFGPLFRFVVGCRAAARRVTRSVAATVHRSRATS